MDATSPVAGQKSQLSQHCVAFKPELLPSGLSYASNLSVAGKYRDARFQGQQAFRVPHLGVG